MLHLLQTLNPHKQRPLERIDNLILSMPKRVNMVLKGKGQRIKY